MELSQHAAQQGGVFTLAQALAHAPRSEVRRNVRGQWVRQRRGIYAERAVVQAAEGDARRTHMLACAALVLALGEDAVVSHRATARAAARTDAPSYVVLAPLLPASPVQSP